MKRSNTARSLPVLILAVAAVLAAPAALARDGHRSHSNHNDDRSDYRGDYRADYRGQSRDHDRYDDRDDRYDRYGRDDRRHGRDRVVYVAPRYAPPRYAAPRYEAYPRWSRGARYNTRGYAPTYVVNDYYGYGLRQPPRGYHWRRDDRGDFLLVAIATGIIAEVLFH
ncbi:MAG: RcnB family protein [Xanthomonadales bacterium]|nr:RcnB family protein [Xanthomonadales bacterium]